MDNRRNRPRINIKQTISTAHESGLVLGELSDVSLEGISFYSDTEFPKDAKVFILFPGKDELQENELEVIVIRSTEESGAPLKYKVAAAYVDANLKYLNDMAKVVE